MKKTYIFLFLIFCTSCWQKQEPIETLRPILAQKVQPLTFYNREFIGTLIPEITADLAFPLSGTLASVDFSTGQAVNKGTQLATLNASDYKLKVAAEKATYLTSKATLERSERLLKRNAISLQDYQIATSKYEANKARYLYAQNELENTVLRAPFKGSIEATYADNYQEVTAGQAICKLIDPTKLLVEFTLPQSDISLLGLRDGFSVGIEGHTFAAKVSEVVDASIDGAGIPVTLEITDKNFNPKKLAIKAGFACRVYISVDERFTKGEYSVVPLTAVFATATNNTDKFVWLYDKKTSTVRKQKISTAGLFSSDMVIIDTPLDSSAMVVTAGVYQLINGQKVKL